MDKELLSKVISIRGEDQLDIAQEECAELIQAISKFKRYRTKETELNVLEEMADVRIMQEQLKILFGITDEVLNDEIDCKLDKLKKELEEEGY